MPSFWMTALLRDGTPEGVQQITTRINDISEGSKTDADMLLNADKTVVMHMRNQDNVSPMTQEEALSVCKFTCPHLNCGFGFRFRTKVGMKIHAGTCEWRMQRVRGGPHCRTPGPDCCKTIPHQVEELRS